MIIKSHPQNYYSQETFPVNCRQRQNNTERQLFPLRALHAGVLRQEVQDQRLRHSGLPARTVEDHDAVDGREKLPRLLPAHGGSEGIYYFITYNINMFVLLAIFSFLSATQSHLPYFAEGQGARRPLDTSRRPRRVQLPQPVGLRPVGGRGRRGQIRRAEARLRGRPDPVRPRRRHLLRSLRYIMAGQPDVQGKREGNKL